MMHLLPTVMRFAVPLLASGGITGAVAGLNFLDDALQPEKPAREVSALHVASDALQLADTMVGELECTVFVD